MEERREREEMGWMEERRERRGDDGRKRLERER